MTEMKAFSPAPMSSIADFDIFIQRVLSHEGNYVNNPKDPGGETKYGISKRTYPGEDIKNLTRDRAIVLYRRDFWDTLKPELMYRSIAFQALDFCVNSGRSTAIRKLQSAIGIADDGYWGEVSQKSLLKLSDSDVGMLYTAERIDFMRKLSTFPSFGSGWMGRLAGNLRWLAQDTPG